jgi:hypothetical protein
VNSAKTSINERLAAAKDTAGEKLDAAGETATGEKVKSVWDNVSDLAQKGREKFDDTVDKVLNGEELGVNPGDWARATTDEAKRRLIELSDNEHVKAATKWGKEMLDDAGLDAAKRADVLDAMSNIKDRTGQMAMAGLKKTWDTAKAGSQMVNDFVDTVKDEYAKSKAAAERADVDVEARTVDEPTSAPEQLGYTPPPATKPTIAERKAFLDAREAEGMDPAEARQAYIESLSKKSEDYSGANAAVAKAIQESGIVTKRPELFGSDESINSMADALRVVAEQAVKGKLSEQVVSKMADVFGKDAPHVINTVSRVLAGANLDPAQTDRIFKAINRVDDAQKSRGDLQQFLTRSMTDESFKSSLAKGMLPEFADTMVRHARGELTRNSTPEEAKAINSKMAELMQEHFGEHADAVSKRIEQEAKRSQTPGDTRNFNDVLRQAGVGPLRGPDQEGSPNMERGGGADYNDDVLTNEHGDELRAKDNFDEDGNRLQDAEQDKTYFGLSKPNISGHQSSVINGTAMHEKSQYAEKYLQALKDKYSTYSEEKYDKDGNKIPPRLLRTAEQNGYDIRFEKMEGSEFGHIVVEDRKNPGEFNADELDRMKLDAKLHSNSPSRIEIGTKVTTGGKKSPLHIIDAVKVAKFMRNKMQDKFQGDAPTTSTQRLVDGFKQGIALLSAQFKQKINVSNDAVIGRIGGKPLTWGAAKKLDVRTADDKLRDSNAREQEQLRVAYRQAKAAGATPEALGKIRDAHKELTNEHASVLDAELARGEDYQTMSRPTAKAAPRSGKDEAVGTTRYDNGTEKDATQTLKADRDGNIHEAAARLKGDELIHRSNMDGSGQWVSSRADAREALDNAANELKARTSKAQQALGDRLKSLLTAEVQIRMTDKDRASLGRVLALKKPSELAGVINPLAEKYGKPVESVVVSREKAPSAPMAVPKEDFFALAKRETAEFKNASLAWLTKEAAMERATAPHQEESGSRDGEDYDPGMTNARLDALETEIASRKNAKPETISAPKTNILANAIAKRQEYLNNPPASYAPADNAAIASWARAQLDRVLERQKNEKGASVDRQDQLSDYKADLMTLLAKSKSVAEGDNSLKDFEGSPDPKAQAAKTAAAAKSGEDKRSAESTDPNINNAKTYSSSDIKDHIEKVLGKSVKLAWASFTHAGEFTRARTGDIIRLSIHALDPMSTAYHESLHAFFAQLRDAGAHDIINVVTKAASSEHVIKQLNELFKNQPEVLKQLKDPEERAAYMYQMWAADPKSFKVSINAKNTFQKMAAFIRKVMGTWTNDERAQHIMNYFHEGQYARDMGSPSAVRHVLMDSHKSQILDTARSFTEPLGRLADALVGMGGDRLRNTGVPALKDLADIIDRDSTTEGGDQGFIQASRIKATKMRTEFGELLHGLSDEQAHDTMEALQGNRPAASPEAQLAVRNIKQFLAESHKYMTQAGVKLGNLGPNYFPRVWDTHYISKNQQAFRDMLEPYIRSGAMKGSADSLISRLTSHGGAELGIDSRETNQPGMQHAKERLLSFITPADAAQFLEKNLFTTMSSYINQAARKAEWTRRLGNGKLEQLLADAKSQGASKEHLNLAEDFMKGVDGTLGDDMNPTARRMVGNMLVYQNVRLLPMAAFSMLIDPMGLVVRGGTVNDAWGAFKRGMKGVTQTFSKEGSAAADQGTKWAELVGAVDSSMMGSVMGDVFSQGMVGGTAQKINNAYFKYNLVEGLNRSFRVGAVEAAVRFLGRHAEGLEGLGDSTHSKRWMRELGLRKGDIVKVGDHIALTEADGLTPDQVTRVHAAINQWVDGAVLRPDAANKPIWMNDPHYALIAHLKQFVFAFQKVILGRVMHEVRHGNYAPMAAMASYVPIMIAADTAKGLIQGGGDTPEWKKGWDLSDYIGYGIQRAGLLGVGQFGLDVATDIHHGGIGVGALTGPTIEQLVDGLQTLSGRKPVGSTVMDALPANALYKESIGGGSDGGPMFSD